MNRQYLRLVPVLGLLLLSASAVLGQVSGGQVSRGQVSGGNGAASPASPPVVVPAAPPIAAPAPGTMPPPAPPPVPLPQSPAPQPAIPPAVSPSPPAEAAKPNDGAAGTLTEVAARPVLILKGKSTWDDGFTELKKSLTQLEGEAKRLGLAGVDKPMAYFVDSDDNGFTFEAMLPLAVSPAPEVKFSTGFEAGLSPAGRAVVFLHEGAYDDIDTAYEALTAWLDDKGYVSTGKFLEEYQFWPEKSDDTGMKLKITVFLTPPKP